MDITLQYPSNWRIFQFEASPLSALKGLIYFELPHEDYKIKDSIPKEYDISNEPSILIMAEKISFVNINLTQYAKIQNDNLKQLFSDFDLKINNISIDRDLGNNHIHIDNYPALKLEYSINIDPHKNNYDQKIRNGLEIWFIRGETAYTISYIASEDNYFKNLFEVQKLINSIKIENSH